MRRHTNRALAAAGAAVLLPLTMSPALAGPGQDNGQPPAQSNSQAALSHANSQAPAHSNSQAALGHGNGETPGQGDGEAMTEALDSTDNLGPSLHPSGRDRTDHQDKRQGNSPSDPDGDGRGPDRNDLGVDKPGEDGGLYDGDQDGNNGCGNDQDFEDDNEGWCGPRPRPVEVEEISIADVVVFEVNEVNEVNEVEVEIEDEVEVDVDVDVDVEDLVIEASPPLFGEAAIAAPAPIVEEIDVQGIVLTREPFGAPAAAPEFLAAAWNVAPVAAAPALVDEETGPTRLARTGSPFAMGASWSLGAIALGGRLLRRRQG